MATEIKVPELGENVAQGTVVRLLVAAGDRVRSGQPVLELETDKATVEIPSDAEGAIAALLVQPGETVRIGQPVIRLVDASAAPGAGASTITRPPSAAPAGGPASAPGTAPRDGPGEAGPVPEASARDRTLDAVEGAGAEGRPAAGAAGPRTREALAASPAVRRCAREVGVDLAAVRGTGPDGLITFQDVFRAAMETGPRGATSAAAARAAAAPGAPEVSPLPDPAAFGPVERRPLSALRRTAAERLTRSWTTAPHVYQFDAADLSRLESMRKRQAEEAGPDGVRVSITAILVRIAAAALRVHPRFNASLDPARGEVVLKRYVHIGVAVDTPHGLMVPVLRDADRKDAVELSAELAGLAARARARTIRPEELQGGCFSISNLGGLGGKHFAPVINPPEVAVLGVGRAALEPVAAGGAVGLGLRLPLSLAYDHRAVDGADGTRFLRWIVEAIEEPVRVALEL